MLVLKNRELSMGKQSVIARLGERTDSTFQATWIKVRYYFAHVNATNAIGSVQWLAFHFLTLLKKMYIKLHEFAYGNPHSKKVIDMVKGRGVEHTRGAASFFLKKISEEKIVGKVREEIKGAQNRVQRAQAKVQATVQATVKAATNQVTQDFFPRVGTRPAMVTTTSSINVSSPSSLGTVSTMSTVFPHQAKVKPKKPKHVSFRQTKPIIEPVSVLDQTPVSTGIAPNVSLKKDSQASKPTSKIVQTSSSIKVVEVPVKSLSRPLVRNADFKRKSAKPIAKKNFQENGLNFD